MKDLLDKISSYNLFNYLFPGVLFAVISEKVTLYSLVQENIIIGAFFYYFIGLVISRFGSLIIEPLLKKVDFVNFSDYGDFVKASKSDEKIEILSEVNNMYRTIASTIVLIFILIGYEKLEKELGFVGEVGVYLLLGILFVMFLFSYRKQTAYITKRVDSYKEGK